MRIFFLFLCSISTLVGQNNIQQAQQAMQAAKDGTMLVVIEKFEKNIAALENQIAREEDPEIIQRLNDQIEYKQQFSKLYETSAVYAFERFYTFGKYQIVNDSELKILRKSLEANEEPYLIYFHKYTADEFAIMDSDNSKIPKPFPQQFDGILAQMKTVLSDADKNLEMYKQFFGKSIYTLNKKLDYQYNNIGYKFKRKELNRIKWLIGTWKREGKQEYEQWVKGPKGMVGTAYKIINNEREVIEKIEMYFIDRDLVYEVSGIHPEPILFEIKDRRKRHFKAENRDNDYPKTITYRMDGKYLKVDLKNDTQSETLDYLWYSN